jgi:DNA repair protein RadC
MTEKTITYKHGEYSQEVVDLSREMLEKELKKKTPEATRYNKTSLIIEHCFQHFGLEDVECLYIVYFNCTFQVLESKRIGTGTVNGVTLFSREVARDCINNNATRVVIVHNHPRGPAEFSEEDKEMTRALNNTLKSFGVQLIDHYLLGGEDFVSFSKEVEAL